MQYHRVNIFVRSRLRSYNILTDPQRFLSCHAIDNFVQLVLLSGHIVVMYSDTVVVYSGSGEVAEMIPKEVQLRMADKQCDILPMIFAHLHSKSRVLTDAK